LSENVAILLLLLYNVNRGDFMSFGEKIWQSLFSSDWYILFAFFLTLLCLSFVWYFNMKTKKEIVKCEQEKNIRHITFIYNWFTVFYTLFITAISIFPLLGMFGTVKALLELDLSNINNAKNNFFDALTSTTWGIIFSIGFKIVNAFISTSVENNIQKLADLIKKFEDSGIGLKDLKKENEKRRAVK
jgi:chemotaxis protein MotA